MSYQQSHSGIVAFCIRHFDFPHCLFNIQNNTIHKKYTVRLCFGASAFEVMLHTTLKTYFKFRAELHNVQIINREPQSKSFR